MISVFLDPVAHHRQPPVLVASPNQAARPCPTHPLDREILNALASASEPVGTWQLLNSVAKAARPASRVEARLIRMEALARVTPLVRCGAVKRVGRAALALP